MDPACDVMLAYKQNGRFLQPDHGFPIRMIIPGHIGARALHAQLFCKRQGWGQTAWALCNPITASPSA